MYKLTLIFILLVTCLVIQGTEMNYEDAGITLYIPDSWQPYISDDDAWLYATSEEENIYLVMFPMAAIELTYAERISLIYKGLMEVIPDYVVDEEEALELNSIPIYAAYGTGTYQENEVGGSVMLLGDESGPCSILVIVGSGEGWEQYGDEIVNILVSLNWL